MNAVSAEEDGAGREGRIAQAFVSLADTLVDEYDMLDLLDRLVGVSVDLLSMDVAFDRLRGYARSHNYRLTEVARQLVEHDLPPAEVILASESR